MKAESGRRVGAARLGGVVLALWLSAVAAWSQTERAQAEKGQAEKSQTEKTGPGKNSPSFGQDLQPIFRKYCLDCHAEMVKMGSLDLETHGGVMSGGNHGKIVVPGKADESRLYLMAAHKMQPIMPMDGRLMTAEELSVLRNWINAGAKPDEAEKKEAKP